MPPPQILEAMTCKNLRVVVVLLSVILGVDAVGGRSPRKTEKLYRKAGKWQRKLRDVWALLGVKPFLVQPGEEGDECVLKSKVEEDYVLKSTVEADACGSGTVLDASTMKCVVEATDPEPAEPEPVPCSGPDDCVGVGNLCVVPGKNNPTNSCSSGCQCSTEYKCTGYDDVCQTGKVCGPDGVCVVEASSK